MAIPLVDVLSGRAGVGRKTGSIKLLQRKNSRLRLYFALPILRGW